MKMSGRAWVVALAALVAATVSLVPADAWAGPPPTATDVGSLLRLFQQMRASVSTWERGGQDAARVAFAALAALNFAWLGVELLSSQSGDIRGGLGRLGRELMVTSILYSLIELGPQLARQIVDFLRGSADGIAGAAGEDQVWNALQEVVKASIGLLSNGEAGYLELLWLGLCVVVVIALVGLTGAIMLVTEGATELILGLGAIVLGGGGAIWTRFLVQNYLKFSFSAGLALYVMRFVQSFVISNLSVWAKETSGSAVDGVVNATVAATSPLAGGPETIFTLLLTVIIQLVLVTAMPTVAVILASGGVGRLSEWAGLGAAQRLGGMGSQGLRQMMSSLSSGGSARSSVGASAGAGSGQSSSVIGSTGGAIPPASGGGARDQGLGNARGADTGASGAGGPQAGVGADSPSPVGGEDNQALGATATEQREGAEAQRSAGGSALERKAPAESGVQMSVAGTASGGPATSLSSARGRESGGGAAAGAAGGSSAKNAWSGQTAAGASQQARPGLASTRERGEGTGEGSSRGQHAQREHGASAAVGGSGLGRSASAEATGGSRAAESRSLSGAESGGASSSSAPPGTPGTAGSGGAAGAAGAASAAGAAGSQRGSGAAGAAAAIGGGQGRASAAAGAAPRASGGVATEGAGASRVTSAGTTGGSAASPPGRAGSSAGAAAVPSVSGSRGGASPGGAKEGGGRGTAPTSTGGVSQMQGVRRVAASGTGARGAAGKRGERG